MLIAALAISLCACGLGDVTIEDCEWELRQAWHAGDGTVVAIAANVAPELYPDAAVVAVTLTASDGVITIIDETNGKVYTGTYEVDRRTPDGTNYAMTVEGISGHATAAMTTYYGGTEEPTLPINLGNYSLYFYKKG